MATNDEILMAVEIVRDYAQNPSVGVVKETLDGLENSITPASAPVVDAPETSTVDSAPVDSGKSN